LTALIVGIVLKDAHYQSTSFSLHLEELRQAVEHSAWEESERLLAALVDEWQARRPWLQVTNSVGTIVEIDRALARVSAAVELREGAAALVDVRDLETLWRDLVG